MSKSKPRRDNDAENPLLDVEFENITCMGQRRDGEPCNRVLALQAILEGTVVIKCRSCGLVNVVDIRGLRVIKSRTVDQGLGQIGSRAERNTAKKKEAP